MESFYTTNRRVYFESFVTPFLTKYYLSVNTLVESRGEHIYLILFQISCNGEFANAVRCRCKMNFPLIVAYTGTAKSVQPGNIPFVNLINTSISSKLPSMDPTRLKFRDMILICYPSSQ